MNSTVLKPGAEGHAAQINWPKPTRVAHAQTGACQPAGRRERKGFVDKWGHV